MFKPNRVSGLFLAKMYGNNEVRKKINLTPFSLFVVWLLTASANAADTEIHRCLLADGTVAFQETPCAEPAAGADSGRDSVEDHSAGTDSAEGDDFFDFVNPFDEASDSPTTAEAASPGPESQNRAECEKTTRDAIDAIDLEMREKTYTKEQGQEYLTDLLALTRQLRDCMAL